MEEQEKDDKSMWDKLADLSDSDKRILGSIGLDAVGLLASLVPGGGAAATLAGMGSTATQLYDDIKKDGFQFSDLGNAAFNLGLDIVSFAPVVGTQTKAIKAEKNIIKHAPYLLKTFGAVLSGLGMYEAKDALVKITKGEKIEMLDIRNIATAVIGLRGVLKHAVHPDKTYNLTLILKDAKNVASDIKEFALYPLKNPLEMAAGQLVGAATNEALLYTDLDDKHKRLITNVASAATMNPLGSIGRYTIGKTLRKHGKEFVDNSVLKTMFGTHPTNNLFPQIISGIRGGVEGLAQTGFENEMLNGQTLGENMFAGDESTAGLVGTYVMDNILVPAIMGRSAQIRGNNINHLANKMNLLSNGSVKKEVAVPIIANEAWKVLNPFRNQDPVALGKPRTHISPKTISAACHKYVGIISDRSILPEPIRKQITEYVKENPELSKKFDEAMDKQFDKIDTEIASMMDPMHKNLDSDTKTKKNKKTEKLKESDKKFIKDHIGDFVADMYADILKVDPNFSIENPLDRKLLNELMKVYPEKLKFFLTNNTGYMDRLQALTPEGTSYQQIYLLNLSGFISGWRLHPYVINPDTGYQLYLEVNATQSLHKGLKLAQGLLTVANSGFLNPEVISSKDSKLTQFAKRAMMSGHQARWKLDLLKVVLATNDAIAFEKKISDNPEGWKMIDENGETVPLDLAKLHFFSTTRDFDLNPTSTDRLHPIFNAHGEKITYVKGPDGTIYTIEADFGGAGSAGDSENGVFTQFNQLGEHPIITLNVRELTPKESKSAKEYLTAYLNINKFGYSWTKGETIKAARQGLFSKEPEILDPLYRRDNATKYNTVEFEGENWMMPDFNAEAFETYRTAEDIASKKKAKKGIYTMPEKSSEFEASLQNIRDEAKAMSKLNATAFRLLAMDSDKYHSGYKSERTAKDARLQLGLELQHEYLPVHIKTTWEKILNGKVWKSLTKLFNHDNQ